MKHLFFLFLPLSMSGIGQVCSVDMARLPTTPPVATLQVQAPSGFAGGPYALQVRLSVAGEVNLSGHTARLRRENRTYPAASQVCTAGALQTVPLAAGDNGQHQLVLEAYAYYRVFEGGSWQIRKALVERRDHPFVVYLPWSSNSAALTTFLRQEWEAGKGGGIDGEKRLTVWGILRTLSPELQTTLRQMKDGGFTDCNIFGVCAVVPPARVRLLNDDPSRFLALVDLGCLSGGIISGCQRPRDSRVSNVGSKIAGGLLLVEGLRHGYLIVGEGVETSGTAQIIELPLAAVSLFVQSLMLNEAFSSGRELRP